MIMDVEKLEVSLEEGERWRRTLRITVPSELVEAERQVALKKLSSRLNLPGFRSGKVPRSVVEKRFGPALDQELLDRVVGEAYREVLQERALKPISEGEVHDVDYQPQADLSFRVSFDVAPQVELARVGGFKVRRSAVSVSDEEVDKVLARVREQEGTWVPVEEGQPGEGDMVTVRILQIEEEDGEPRRYEFTLGKGEAIPDVEEAIRSLEVGESGEFTVSFPDDEAGGDEGEREQRLRIFLDGRKELELPELDAEFARSAGNFESVDELRARIREDLEAEAEREGEARIRAALLEQVVAANPFEIPESMVDQYVRSALGNPEDLTEERLKEAKEQLRPRAVQGVKRFLVVERMAEEHGLKATEDEIDARIEEIAERSDANPADVYGRLQRSGQLEQLEREITERKVFGFLKEQSTIDDPE